MRVVIQQVFVLSMGLIKEESLKRWKKRFRCFWFPMRVE